MSNTNGTTWYMVNYPDRLRAAIAADRAQPEPAGLSDEELLKALKLAINSFPPAHPDAEGMSCAQYEVTLELRKARAVEAASLARVQRQPVPVSERLPGDELCWWFEADEDCGYGSNWTLLRIRGSAIGYTHWLPAHALPLPGEVKG